MGEGNVDPREDVLGRTETREDVTWQVETLVDETEHVVGENGCVEQTCAIDPNCVETA